MPPDDVDRTDAGRKESGPARSWCRSGSSPMSGHSIEGRGESQRDRAVRRFVGSLLIPAYLSLNGFGGNFTDLGRFSILTEFLAGAGIARRTACDGIRNSKRGSFPRDLGQFRDNMRDAADSAQRNVPEGSGMPTEHVHVISPNEIRSLRTPRPNGAHSTEPTNLRTASVRSLKDTNRHPHPKHHDRANDVVPQE